jgi:hypothetical protein
MLKRIEGYWMAIVAPSFSVQAFTLDPLPRGTNIYASISLSNVVNFLGFRDDTPPDRRGEFAADAYVESWTFYNSDGTESLPQFPPPVRSSSTQNAVMVENCARIKFVLYGFQVNAIAQVNIFTL